jgi:hypothetical protein
LLIADLGKATHSERKEWPGESTAPTLKKLGITLRIKDNEHGITVNTFCGKVGPKSNKQLKLIIRVFEDNLVVLTGPPVHDAPAIVGADPDKVTNNQPNSSKELTRQSKRRALNRGKEPDGGADVGPAKKKGLTQAVQNQQQEK